MEDEKKEKLKVWEVLSSEERTKSEFRKNAIPVHQKPRESGGQKAVGFLGQLGRGLAASVAPVEERVHEPRSYTRPTRKVRKSSQFSDRKEGHGLGYLGKPYWKGPGANLGHRSYYETSDSYFGRSKFGKMRKVR